MSTAREQALIEMRRTRENAERLLHSLLEAHAACEAQLASDKRSDMVKKVTGKTSLEQAIENTRRMIDVLLRAEEEPAADGHRPSLSPPNSESNPNPSSSLASSAPSPEIKPARLDDDDSRDDDAAPVVGVIRAVNPAARSTVFFASRTTTLRTGSSR
jgi:hypothetical protein